MTEKKSTDLNKTIQLRYPFDFEGRKIETIALDLSKLTSAALKRAERRLVEAQGIPIGAASMEYCLLAAAEASGEPPELFDRLVGPDAQEVMLTVQGFLLDAGSVKPS